MDPWWRSNWLTMWRYAFIFSSALVLLFNQKVTDGCWAESNQNIFHLPTVGRALKWRFSSSVEKGWSPRATYDVLRNTFNCKSKNSQEEAEIFTRFERGVWDKNKMMEISNIHKAKIQVLRSKMAPSAGLYWTVW